MTRLRDYLNAQPLDRLDTDLLAAHALGVERNYLYSHPEHGLVPEECERLERLIRDRASGVPLAYLTGRQEFWSLDLEVDRRVLIPRPETELLVEVALTRVATSDRILDLGTGSGAIALALATERPACRLTATDSDPHALAVAQVNASRLGLPITLLLSDWFAEVDGSFELIVSNPPYVAANDPHLDALSHEPRTALVSGPEGLDDLRAIVADAARHLATGGWLVVEHGFDQGSDVRDLFRKAGLEAVETHRDLAGHERVTLGQLRPGDGP